MYDSKPMGKEGEPIETIVPAAIQATSSTERADHRARGTREPGALDQVPYRNRPFQAAVALAVVELLILAALVIGGIV